MGRKVRMTRTQFREHLRTKEIPSVVREMVENKELNLTNPKHRRIVRQWAPELVERTDLANKRRSRKIRNERLAIFKNHRSGFKEAEDGPPKDDEDDDEVEVEIPDEEDEEEKTERRFARRSRRSERSYRPARRRFAATEACDDEEDDEDMKKNERRERIRAFRLERLRKRRAEADDEEEKKKDDEEEKKDDEKKKTKDESRGPKDSESLLEWHQRSKQPNRPNKYRESIINKFAKDENK